MWSAPTRPLIRHRRRSFADRCAHRGTQNRGRQALCVVWYHHAGFARLFRQTAALAADTHERNIAIRDNSTGGRRGISAAIFALLLTTAACGTAQATDPDYAVPAPPAVVKQGTGAISADAAERAGQETGEGGTGVTSGKRLGERRLTPVRRFPDARP